MNTDKLEKKARDGQLLNSIVESQGWKDTVGLFLSELQNTYFNEFLNCQDKDALLRLQGSLATLKRLEHYFKSVLQEGEAARIQILKQVDKGKV